MFKERRIFSKTFYQWRAIWMSNTSKFSRPIDIKLFYQNTIMVKSCSKISSVHTRSPRRENSEIAKDGIEFSWQELWVQLSKFSPFCVSSNTRGRMTGTKSRSQSEKEKKTYVLYLKPVREMDNVQKSGHYDWKTLGWLRTLAFCQSVFRHDTLVLTFWWYKGFWKHYSNRNGKDIAFLRSLSSRFFLIYLSIYLSIYRLGLFVSRHINSL